MHANGGRRASGGGEPEAREFLAHPRPDYLQRRGGAEHHLQLRDASVLIEGELVDALDPPTVHLGRELQESQMRVTVLELVDMAKVAAAAARTFSTVSRPA